jgi:hypothetical protein
VTENLAVMGFNLVPQQRELERCSGSIDRSRTFVVPGRVLDIGKKKASKRPWSDR